MACTLTFLDLQLHLQKLPKIPNKQTGRRTASRGTTLMITKDSGRDSQVSVTGALDMLFQFDGTATSTSRLEVTLKGTGTLQGGEIVDEEQFV